MLRFLSLAAVLLLAAPLVRAQADPALRRVVLTDGTVYVGTVADESADPVVVVTTDGVSRTFARRAVELVAPFIRGRFFRTDPVRSRLFFSPTARTLGGGQVRLSFLGAPNVAVGLTDRVDASATGYFALGDGGGVLPLLGIKGTVLQSENLSVAFGASVLIPFADNSDINGTVVGFPYGVVTLGDETRSVSVGLTGIVGRDGSNGSFEVGNGAALSLGGETQINNGVKLLVDGIVPITDGFSGAAAFPGIRLFGNRFAFDVFGIVAVYRDETEVYNPTTQTFTTRGETKFFAFAPIGGSVSYTF